MHLCNSWLRGQLDKKMQILNDEYMDITKHPKLDPKLQETYDRIMGTAVGVKAPTHPAPAAHPAQKAAPTTHKDAPEAHHTNGHLSHIAYNASSAQKKEPVMHVKSQTQAVKSDSLLLPLLMGIGGVIFFVAYAIFWMRFFGL